MLSTTTRWAGSLPGDAGGPRWKGRLRAARRHPRSQPSPARSRCRTPGRWSPRRRTSSRSFSGVCRLRKVRWPTLSAHRDVLLRVPGGGDRAEGVWRTGDTCHLPCPQAEKESGRTQRGLGVRERREGERNHPGFLGRRLALCPRCKEGQSPPTRSSPVLYIFAFSQTGSPLWPHQHPRSCRAPAGGKSAESRDPPTPHTLLR